MHFVTSLFHKSTFFVILHMGGISKSTLIRYCCWREEKPSKIQVVECGFPCWLPSWLPGRHIRRTVGITEAAFWGWLVTDWRSSMPWQMADERLLLSSLSSLLQLSSFLVILLFLTTCLCSQWMIGIKIQPRSEWWQGSSSSVRRQEVGSSSGLGGLWGLKSIHFGLQVCNLWKQDCYSKTKPNLKRKKSKVQVKTVLVFYLFLYYYLLSLWPICCHVTHLTALTDFCSS